MVRIKQFADDLAISTKKAKDLINKGRNRKDGGSQILESVMSDTDKKKKKKKDEMEYTTAEFRIDMIPEKDREDYIKKYTRGRNKGGSNVTTMNTDKLSKAQLAQFTNIKNDAVNGKISPAEAQKMIRKMLTIKRKDGGLQDIPSDNKGLPNLPTEVRNKMGYKKNGGMQTSPKQRKHGTAKGMGTGLSKKPQIVKSPHARGGSIAIQGLGFKGVR